MFDFFPKPEHKFTFGLWTVRSRGVDPFGSAVRPHKSPAELVYLLGEVGAYGVNFHDNDLIPINTDDGSMAPYFGKYSPEKAAALKRHSFDRSAISGRGLKYERLDQLTIDLLLGVR